MLIYLQTGQIGRPKQILYLLFYGGIWVLIIKDIIPQVNYFRNIECSKLEQNILLNIYDEIALGYFFN